MSFGRRVSQEVADFRRRLEVSHQSAERASKYAGTLLERIAALEKQVEDRDNAIAALRRAVDNLHAYRGSGEPFMGCVSHD
jgi:hypothetical protein